MVTRMTGRGAARRTMGILAVLVLAGCGGGGEDDGETDDGDDTRTEDTTGGADDESVDADDTVATVAPTVAPVDILTDFGQVCQGVPLPGATAYDPARTGIHPIMVLDGEDPTYETSLALLPDEWDPVIGQEQTVELVVCMNRTSSTLRQTCDGYLDDNDQDTGNVVEMYDASYDVRVLTATTGEVVAQQTFDATDDLCPSFVFFDADQTVKPVYATPDDALTAFLAPIVQT